MSLYGGYRSKIYYYPPCLDLFYWTGHLITTRWEPIKDVHWFKCKFNGTLKLYNYLEAIF